MVRSDPKADFAVDYSAGHGPQGDVVRIYNLARCVRGTSATTNDFPMVDTKTTACYDDGTSGGAITCPAATETYHGQDATYSGLAPSYTATSSTVVTDNNTGLMWEKGFSQVAWADAEAAATAATTGGYSDWRVATVKEMYSLIQFNGATGTSDPSATTAPSDAVPYIDTDAFSFEYGTSNRYIDAQYITSTSYVSTTMNNDPTFFGVNFADGRIKGYPKTSPTGGTYYLRLVRGNAKYGSNNFTDNSDDTITDAATGLIWMKKDSAHADYNASVAATTKATGHLNWAESLAFCEGLSLAGASDWRLPNAKELQAIVDYSRSPATTSSAAIDAVFTATAITDEGAAENYAFYWTGTTHLDGDVGKWGVYVAFGKALGFFAAP